MLNISHKWAKIQLSLLLLLLSPFAVIAQPNPTDKLAYTINKFDGKTPLMMYDPLSQSSNLLRSDTEPGQFNMSRDRQLAFSSKKNGKVDVYVLNTSSANNTPINISQNPEAYNYPLGWSPDGSYLAFASRKANDRAIYVWNGNKAINITPADIDPTSPYFYASGDISWSNDNRLAFTVWYPTKGDDSEIYIWNGINTFNFSRNPTGEDRGQRWSTDNRLAFLSSRNGKYDIFVWDGMSYKNDLPDTDTFINVAPDFTSYMSFPTWTNNGTVAFDGQGSQDTHLQVYVWNGERATNITQNPDLHNGFPTWNVDGQWAFSTFWSSKQLVFVKDADNQTIFTVEGQYPPTWSSDGNLAFCTYSSGTWTLSVWDGKTVTKLAEGGDISAQWFSGSSVYCSSG